MRPREVRLGKGGTGIEIRWPDGVTHRLGAGMLRAHCRSATAISGAIKRGGPSDLGAVRITAIEPIGSYAVHLAFSDGEARGIYPWSLLRSIGE